MCHSYSLFPFYTPLSLPSFLSFLRTRSFFFFFFFTFLRYANCLERVTSSTNCKWQGLIRFASQYLGRVFFFSSFPFNFACVGSHDRVWNFILFLFFSSSFLSPFSSSLIFLFFYTTRSVASVRSVHLTRSAIISLVPAWHLISLFVLVRSRPVCSLFRSFPVISSSEVRCASLRVVMPPHY